jgi:hypothetical protein
MPIRARLRDLGSSIKFNLNRAALGCLDAKDTQFLKLQRALDCHDGMIWQLAELADGSPTVVVFAAALLMACLFFNNANADVDGSEPHAIARMSFASCP